MRPHFRTFFLSCLLLLAVSSARAAAPFPAGPAQAPLARMQIAVYYPAPPTSDPLALMRTLAPEFKVFSVISELPKDKPGKAILLGMMEKDVQKNYTVPSVEALAHFGRSLSAQQKQALQGARQALVMNFMYPKADTLAAVRAGSVLAEQVARRTGGLLWDEETRQVMTPDHWHKERLAGWTTAVPDLASHIVIHSYKEGDMVRAISLGMGKFGLPDLSVEQYPWSSNDAVQALINLLAQSLAEGGAVGPRGHYELAVRSIAHPGVRARMVESIHKQARGAARLTLVQGTAQEGDPANRIAEITFAAYPGPDATARQGAALHDLLGAEPAKVVAISHNDELERESERARARLPALQQLFAKGLRPGEYIMVKAPFATASDGTEWMWVEVTAWTGGIIDGILTSTPRDIPALRAGQQVKVKQADLFDYLHQLPDGKTVGNTTSVIILKMQKAKQ